VTVIGDIQSVTANPPGTTRGTYTVLDDSGPTPLSIQTKDLPPIGRTYSVTGVIIQDPTQANVPIMRELKRTSPGMTSTMKILLYGGGALFLILLIIFIVLLAKPKKAVVQQTARPAPGPAPPPQPAAPDISKTTKIQTTDAAPPTADKTQVYMSLGADALVERGPDKGKEFAFHKQVTTIGRAGSRKNDIELSDDTVSKTQASVFYDNTVQQFSISNESTTNPTKVNGALLKEPVQLKDNDLIEMGKSSLRFKKQ
jgi:hypothetical protein